MADYDLVVRNADIITESDRFAGDIGIQDGVIEAIGEALGPGRERSMPQGGSCYRVA